MRSVGFVPPHQSVSAWTRRLELATFVTQRARPPLEAVAIDLERCLRSRFPQVEWSPGPVQGDVSVHRWTASGADASAALDGLTVLRAGPGRAWVATFAARGEALGEPEIQEWTAALLALQPHPVVEAAR